MGVNSSYYPINETSSFTPLDPDVYYWLNFTYINASFDVTYTFYYPNGTEASSLSQGSNTLDAGNLWQTIYLYFPLAGEPFANVTGQWFVNTYLNGTEVLRLPFYVGSYSSPLVISESAVSPEQNSTGYPINSTIYYTTNSAEVYSFLWFGTIGSATYNVTSDFVTPGGTVFGSVNQTFTGPYPGYFLTSYLKISGYPAANDPGQWYLKIYINGDFSSPALVQTFYVSG